MSVDGRWLAGSLIAVATGKAERKLVVWDVEAKDSLASRRIFDWQGAPGLFMLSPKGKWLAMASQKGGLVLHLLTSDGGTAIEVPLDKEQACSLQFSADDKQLYVGCTSENS